LKNSSEIVKKSIEQKSKVLKSIDKQMSNGMAQNESIEQSTMEQLAIGQKSKEITSIDKKATKNSIETKTIALKSKEQKSIDKGIGGSKIWNDPIEQNAKELDTIEQLTIENKSKDIRSIFKETIDYNIEQNAAERKSPGIHPTSIRVVKEELLKALGDQISAEIKIGDIAPLTGLTRRTVDRVCKYLEENGDFSFERQHRGMKVTVLNP
jgi:hypothetical protein